MIPQEIFQKIRRVEIITNHLVSGSLSGGYESAFKGQGIEFSELREYEYGDDVRLIDWNVSARQNKPFIKKFTEERECTVMFLVDMSASMRFASSIVSKKDMAAEVVALLAFSALRNGDKVGFMSFSEQVEKYVPPRKNKQHILRMIRDILCYEASYRKTNLAKALDCFNRAVRKKTILFVVSDFWSENYETYLRSSSLRHDVIPVVFLDPMEKEIPFMGKILWEDLETQKILETDTSSSIFRKSFSKKIEEYRTQRRDIFNRLKLDAIDLSTNESYAKSIVAFFKKRGRYK
ncbi:hypothetical protein AB834_06205 [PVC group bacterium (ex Bugula neritina AB1)]|nr:hypothetical protein AB834_06205 [PVC group bacterium (ex Bugula neritina AB1)]